MCFPSLRMASSAFPTCLSTCSSGAYSCSMPTEIGHCCHPSLQAQASHQTSLRACLCCSTRSPAGAFPARAGSALHCRQLLALLQGMLSQKRSMRIAKGVQMQKMARGLTLAISCRRFSSARWQCAASACNASSCLMAAAMAAMRSCSCSGACMHIHQRRDVNPTSGGHDVPATMLTLFVFPSTSSKIESASRRPIHAMRMLQ